MFNYEKLFEPFMADGATLENSISWLKKTTKAEDRIIDQAIADTMQRVAEGETFPLPCPCGCEMDNIHTPINHYMLSRVIDLKTQADQLVAFMLQENQKKLIELQMRQLSNFDKEYDKMINGTWWEKFTDYSKSPVVSGLKNLQTWINRKFGDE